MDDWLSLVFFCFFYVTIFKDKRFARGTWQVSVVYVLITIGVWLAGHELEGLVLDHVVGPHLRRFKWLYVNQTWTSSGRVLYSVYEGITSGVKNWLAYYAWHICCAYDNAPPTRTKWYKPVPGKTVGRDVLLARASDSTSFASETITPSPPHPSEPVVDPKP